MPGRITERVRRPAVAGQFYPADPRELRELISSLLDNAAVSAPGPAPKAIIVPHAGYVYSGPIAASAYAAFRQDRDKIRRIVLLGPAHFLPFFGLAASSAEAFATPLGDVPVDLAAVQRLARRLSVSTRDDAHYYEHSLEVQLPFLQVVLKEFQLVPLLAGESTAEEVASALELLWGSDETRFVISSDLSHYLQAEAAREVDQTTADAIEKLRGESVGEYQACGRVPICGLLRAAAAHKLRSQTVDLRNSGDTGGPRERVVGYGAFVFREAGGS